jgi:hypothetical protein
VRACSSEAGRQVHEATRFETFRCRTREQTVARILSSLLGGDARCEERVDAPPAVLATFSVGVSAVRRTLARTSCVRGLLAEQDEEVVCGGKEQCRGHAHQRGAQWARGEHREQRAQMCKVVPHACA